MSRNKRFRSLLLFVILTNSVLPAVAQQGAELRGRIIDQLSKTPIGGALVRLPDQQRYTITNQFGLFLFTALSPGKHRLNISQLGYALAEFETETGTQATLLELVPEPVELKALVVSNGRMDRTAGERANKLRTFWNAWDRQAIVKSGYDQPLEFLRNVARMPIGPCIGEYRIDTLGNRGVHSTKQLCVSAPGIPVPRFHRLPGDWTHLGQMRQASRRSQGKPWRTYYIPPTFTPSFRTPVFLDDRPLGGSVDGIAGERMAHIERVEVYGHRGEHEIRFYTQEYVNLLATGVRRNPLALSADDLFQRTLWELRDSVVNPGIRR